MKADSCFYDFEVELTGAAGVRVIEIGFSPSREEAAQRARLCFPEADDVRVVRVVTEYAPESTPLSELTVTWESVEKFDGKRFVLRDRKGREAASEYQGGHMRTAYDLLARNTPAVAWKTVKLLKTLRHAFREDSASCRTEALEQLLIDGPSEKRINGYLRGARARDHVHHGCHTF